MNQLINAVYENGVLKPEKLLDLPAGARVRIAVEPLDAQTEREKAWEEFDALCEEISIHSQGERLTRDQLHERR